MATLEERVAKLESFIGDISAISVYANSLQEVIDKYLQPLYIESNSNTDTNDLLIDGYLGDVTNIPKNIDFKIRPSHDLVRDTTKDHATITFKNSNGSVSFELRKMVSSGSTHTLSALDDNNYVYGTIYDIYINSEGIAIITSSDTATIVAAELEAAKGRITDIETLTSGITKDATTGAYTLGELNATDITTDNITANTSLTSTGTSTINVNTTINADASSITGDTMITNKKYVDSKIDEKIANYHSTKHVVGSTDVPTSLENGAFYYKMSS